MRALLPTVLAAAFLTSSGVTVFGGGINAVGSTGSSALSTAAGKGAVLELIPGSSAGTGQQASNLVHVGTRVRAVGAGFHRGARVQIIYALAESSFVRTPIARTVVGPRGRFDTSFRVTPAMLRGGPDAASGRYPGPVQPLRIEAFEGASPGVGPRHAHAVAALVVYSQ